MMIDPRARGRRWPVASLAFVALAGALVATSCAAEGVADPLGPAGSGAGTPDAGGDVTLDEPTAEASPDTALDTSFLDIAADKPGWDPDAACAATAAEAEVILKPVDIIWVVDNSASMAPAIDELTAGLNAFAAFIASQNLDYRVIMLSYRSKTNPITINGGTRYGVCIPPPLAGDDNCGNGPRFFQSSIDIRSTQPLEQFLGTLDQTAGYTNGEARGGEQWLGWLRPDATKTIVVVTDDNSRLSADQFEHFPGGQNPFNSLTLPPGILDPSRGGLFDGYVFHALYGWGSDIDPGVKCTYPDQTQPPSSGITYTDLVTRTGGTRAKICDGASAWQPFFDAVVKAVATTSELACEIPIPDQDAGAFDPKLVNVRIVGDAVTEELFKVDGPSACGPDGGWYYDDPAAPSSIVLCPVSCDLARSQVGVGKTGRIEVLFGCDSWVK
jgi:hypothetical protein